MRTPGTLCGVPDLCGCALWTYLTAPSLPGSSRGRWAVSAGGAWAVFAVSFGRPQSGPGRGPGHLTPSGGPPQTLAELILAMEGAVL